jgi:hypothetical protein
MVWIDGTYDMVGVQEQAKYKRVSGVEFGPVDVVKYAEAFGANGYMINSPNQIGPILGTSEVTIKMHRGQVMHKMKAESVVELLRMTETIAPIGAGSSHTKVL